METPQITYSSITVEIGPVAPPTPDERLLMANSGFVYVGNRRVFVGQLSLAKRAPELAQKLRSGEAPPKRPQASRPPRQPRPAPQPQPAVVPVSPADCYAYLYPTDAIGVDVKRFQNRESDYSAESVAKLVEGFDPNRLDPVVVWRDPAGKVWLLSGHSRLEAHRRLGRADIPVREFGGDEPSAIEFARGFANRLGTPETLIEDLKAYRQFASGESSKSKKVLKEMFGRDANRLASLSHLNPRGKFLALLSQPQEVQRQMPYLEMKAAWTGDLRRKYGEKLTNAHEDEIFDYWLTTPATIVPKREEFDDLIRRRVERLDYNAEEPLALRASATGTEARADTGPSQRRIFEIDRELTQLGARQRSALTKEEKQMLQQTVATLVAERDYLKRGIETVLKTQPGLFGRKPKTGIAVRADTAPSYQRIREIEREAKALHKQLAAEKDLTKRQLITRTLEELERERGIHARGIVEMINSQQALFDLPADTQSPTLFGIRSHANS